MGDLMADVIEWLDGKDNKQGYVIDLIRKDISTVQKRKGNKHEQRTI